MWSTIEARADDIAPVHIDSHVIQSPEFPLIVEIEPEALEYVVIESSGSAPE